MNKPVRFISTLLVLPLTFAFQTALAGDLTVASVTFSSLQLNATDSINIKFTSTSELPSNVKIVVGFPDGFDVSKATTNSCTFIGPFTTSVANQTITISRTGNLASIISGQAISCELGNIKNPDTGTS